MAKEKPAGKAKPAEKPKEENKEAKPRKEAKPEPKAPAEAPKAEAKPAAPKPEKPKFNVLLFNRWDVSEVKVEDMGLMRYVNIRPMVVPRTGGKYGCNSVQKYRMPLVERLMNKLMVPGHRGKKHKITSKRCCGNVQAIYLAIRDALDTIEKRTKQNPVQVLVKAVENSAPLEEVAAYRLGGMIARKAVNVSPQRRLDLALRHMSQGIYKAGFRSKKTLAQTIADEVMAAYSNDSKCFAIAERTRLEKEAEGAR